MDYNTVAEPTGFKFLFILVGFDITRYIHLIRYFLSMIFRQTELQLDYRSEKVHYEKNAGKQQMKETRRQ